MKPKTILLSLFFVGGCLCANATDIEIDPKNPGKPVEELNGSVIDAETKKPLKDVTITAYVASKKEKHITSDEWGRYGFDELKPGTYRIVFEKGGYKKIIKEKIIVKTDETFQMNIEMTEAGDFDLMPSPFHLREAW